MASTFRLTQYVCNDDFSSAACSVQLNRYSTCHTPIQYGARMSPHGRIPNRCQTDSLRHCSLGDIGLHAKDAVIQTFVGDYDNRVTILYIPIVSKRNVAIGIAIFNQVRIKTKRPIRQSSVSNRESTCQLTFRDCCVSEICLVQISKREIDIGQVSIDEERTLSIGAPEERHRQISMIEVYLPAVCSYKIGARQICILKISCI